MLKSLSSKRAGLAAFGLAIVLMLAALIFINQAPMAEALADEGVRSVASGTLPPIATQEAAADPLHSAPINEEDLLPQALGSSAEAEAVAQSRPEPQAEAELDPETVAELSVMRGTIGRGDTVGGILQAWLSPQEINQLDKVAGQVFSLRRIKQGQAYSVHTSGKDFVSFEYEVDNDTRLLVSREEGIFKAEKLDIEYEIQLHRVEGEIKSSLFQAMNQAGEGQALAAQLSNVFAWEINFIRDIRVGDRFSILVEKRYRDGEFKGYGKLLAATFVNGSDKYEAFLYRDDDGNSEYFTREGQSLRRAFLKAPLAFTRISSGFSTNRLHPITKEWRAHPAIDYAAPTGTPIKAVGKGTVTFAGYSNSAGNYVIIDHINGYQTLYLHMSSFAKGMKKGNKVAQGQVIGFVGSTGLATGPHLCFRMKNNGSYVNPLTALSPRETPMTPTELEEFQAQIEIFLAFLEDRRNLAEYDRSMLTIF